MPRQTDATRQGPPRKTFLNTPPKAIVAAKGVVITATRPERAKAIAKTLRKPQHIPDDLICNCGSELDGSHDHVTCGPPVPRYQPAPTKPPRRPGRGRRTLAESLTPPELAQEIRELLTDLHASTDPDEKKRLRRALRLRGHRGGLVANPDPQATPAFLTPTKPLTRKAT